MTDQPRPRPARHRRGVIALALAIASIASPALAACKDVTAEEAVPVTVQESVPLTTVPPDAERVMTVVVDRTPSGADALQTYLEWIATVVAPEAARERFHVVVIALVGDASDYHQLGTADFADLGSDNPVVTGPEVSARTQALVDEVARTAVQVDISPTNTVAALWNAMKVMGSPEIEQRRIYLLSDAIPSEPAGCDLVARYRDADPDPMSVAAACVADLPLVLGGADVYVYGAAVSATVDIPDRVVGRAEAVIGAIVTSAGGQLRSWTPDPTVGQP